MQAFFQTLPPFYSHPAILQTLVHASGLANCSNSEMVSSIALLLLPQAGNTVSNRISDPALHLIRRQHLRFRMKKRFVLRIIDLGVSRAHDQHRALLHREGQRLCNPAALCMQRLRRQFDRRRRRVKFLYQGISYYNSHELYTFFRFLKKF